MANNTLKTRILLVSKTTAEWATNATTLMKGEVAIEFTTSGAPKFKVGDGTKTFAQLDYATMTPDEVSAAIETAVQAASHSHNNKEILDAITAAFTTELKAKYDEAATKASSAVQTIKINGVEATKTGDEIDLPAYPTKESLKLDKVENLAPADLPVSTATTQAIADAKADLEKKITDSQYNDTALVARVTANETAIGRLNGEGEGSVKKQIDDAFNDFATKVSDDSVVNTFKELVDYCATHSAEAAEMAGDIQKNATAISTLETYVGKLPEGTSAKDVISYINEKVSAVDFSEAIATAKQEAIDAAKADATTKANTAETNAKKYADGLADNYATADQGKKADSAVQSVKIGETEYKTGTNVVLPEYPTTLPASDVHDWAKAETKPEYTKSEVGLDKVDNTADAEKVVASAGKFTTARDIAIDGAVKASAVSFDGSENITLQVTEIDAAKLKVASADTLILDGNF